MKKKAGVDLGGFGGAEAGFDRDAGLAQPGDPAAGDTRVGILEGYDDVFNTGIDQRAGAGRRLSPMAARLEADIGGGAQCRRSGAAQGFSFGVRPAAGLGPAAADNGSPVDEDAADGRVGPDIAEPAPGERQGRVHPTRIGAPIAVGNRGPIAAVTRHRRRSARRTRQNPSPRGSCGRPRQSGCRRPGRGSPAPP